MRRDGAGRLPARREGSSTLPHGGQLCGDEARVRLKGSSLDSVLRFQEAQGLIGFAFFKKKSLW